MTINNKEWEKIELEPSVYPKSRLQESRMQADMGVYSYMHRVNANHFTQHLPIRTRACKQKLKVAAVTTSESTHNTSFCIKLLNHTV